MILCPQCRSQNQDTAAFCVRCGQPLATVPPAYPAPEYGAPLEQERLAVPGRQKKGMATTSLVLGIVSWPLTCLAVGVLTAIGGLITGIVALTRANKEPAIYAGRGTAIAGIVVNAVAMVASPFLIGIGAAIAIPSLLRARVSANESAAIGDVRTVISAQAAYASANQGFYDTLECLGAPGNCIPDHPASGPNFLDSTLVLPPGGVKSGYKRTLHLGPPPEAWEAKTPLSPSSVKRFAYVAEPAVRNQTGLRSFCGDETGRVCQVTAGPMPDIEDGRCPPSCRGI